MSERRSPSSALSPCIGLCRMEPASRYCEGCLRTRDEIAAWPGLSNADRLSLMARLKQRTLCVDSKDVPATNAADSGIDRADTD
ncbi:DUF1289 domain-containing protein [Rubinisphaera sp. JC750]|uniref:DUF1289 domain-containing protein n=1 Tax=Rubinisphaera sp. JC750 TaxID=2898658 RepID=UPI0039656AF3